MRAQHDTAVSRVAAEYRNKGYNVVVVQPGAAKLPSFLRDCYPDLIAERTDDHVVIEISSRRELKGSNKLTELAARVANQPGWRFELIALSTDLDDWAPVRDPNWLDRMLQQSNIARGSVVQFVYLTEILDYVVRAIASSRNTRVLEKSTLRIAQELTFNGILSQELLERVEHALEMRRMFLHHPPDFEIPADQLDEIANLCRAIRREGLRESSKPAGQ